MLSIPERPLRERNVAAPPWDRPQPAGRPTRRQRLSALSRTAVLGTAGAAPVTAISLDVFGVLPLRLAACFLVVPLLLGSLVLVRRRSPEALWARRGFVAGLAGVAAYDAMRLPLVLLNIWPDFIPRLGGWVLGSDSPDVPVGYLWRWIGDGGGIGAAFFLFCGMIQLHRRPLLRRYPMVLSIGYGVLIWSGLLCTVTLPARGATMLFRLTPLSFVLSLLGHLVYGSVLGWYLRRCLPADGERPTRRPASAARTTT